MTGPSRRRFLELTGTLGLGTGGLLAADALWPFGLGPRDAQAGVDPDALATNAPRARFWASTADKDPDCRACHGMPMEMQAHDHGATVVKCLLCARTCVIPEGGRGMCRARQNVGGELRSLVYGRPITTHVDPIEKKPFYHFLPGSRAFSLATSGCPLRCRFCQNWEISQAKPEDYDTPFVSAEAMVGQAVQSDAPVIAFTYNEATVFAEYAIDIARAGKKKGIRSVLISCGYGGEAVIAEFCEVLAAIKIDLKGFSKAFYNEVSLAEVEPVLRTIVQIARAGVHLEIVNLVVPTLNDSATLFGELSKWVVGELGPDVPIHFTRFHPDYQLPNLPPTPIATLELARNTAMAAGVHYAYVGNAPGHPGDNTYCPKCGAVVIERAGYFIKGLHLTNGACSACGAPIAGVWS